IAPPRPAEGAAMTRNGSAGRVVWHITMSLDGFIAGPDDAMDWAFGHTSGPSAAADEGLRSTRAILAGRRWYDLAAGNPDAAPYGGAWTGPIFVLTHRPPAPSPEAAITFLSDGVPAAVTTALQAAGGLDVVVFGASVAAQCLDAGLLDE